MVAVIGEEDDDDVEIDRLSIRELKEDPGDDDGKTGGEPSLRLA